MNRCGCDAKGLMDSSWHFVIALLIVVGAVVASSTADAFIITPITDGIARRHEPSTLLALDMAAKKNKKKGKVNQSKSSSGKGFGANKSVATLRESTIATESPTHANLLSWLHQNPNTYISPKFSIRPSPLGGYGGFANAPIQANELIFRIPRECCVTYDDALLDPNCGAAFQLIKESKVSSWGMMLIAGWLAKEKILCNTNDYTTTTNFGGVKVEEGMKRVKHADYINTLPWEQGHLGQDHVLFWSDEEVESLLRGSLAYDDAILIRKTVDKTVKLLSDTIVQNILGVRKQLLGPGIQTNDDHEADVRKNLVKAIKASFVIALSRSFAEEVELDDGSIEVENLLLPLIDILQHSNTPNTILEPYDDCVLLRARRDVDADEELFHQYQKEDDNVIPPHKFFTRYGFIPGVREPVVDLLRRRSSLFFDSE